MATQSPQDLEKQAAARAGLKFVQEGDIVGLGSGSTAAYFVRFLAERVSAGLKIRGIPTSVQTQQLAASLGIPLTTLDETQQIDVAVDGADEVDPNLQLIKGGGGAFLREKIIASAARRFVIIADSSKQVAVLGKFAVPVEVVPFAQKLVAREVEGLGASAHLRGQASGQPYVTDEGHHILDCSFGPIPDPGKLASQLESIPGVMEHGLCVNMAEIALIAKGEKVTELRRTA
jgi:ribose 5-phosphate isomerase A